MNRIVTKKPNQIIVVYNLSDVEIDLIEKVKKDGYIEFRRENEQEKMLMCYELSNVGILKYNLDSWHTTFIIGDLVNECLNGG